jgi:hypothetical protein
MPPWAGGKLFLRYFPPGLGSPRAFCSRKVAWSMEGVGKWADSPPPELRRLGSIPFAKAQREARPEKQEILI